VLGRAIRNGTFFERHRGAGLYRAMIEQLFELTERMAGVPVLPNNIVSPATFRRSVSNKSPYFEAG
jgi:predicted acetyltransferase